MEHCNRVPFLSDKECNRGNIDIHQFDDFPYCSPICPSQTEIPPEIVDTPIVVNTPLACSCINIDYDLSLKYGKSFIGKGLLKPIGDCCNGKYESDFNIQIPCPVVCNSNKISIGVEYGDDNDKQTFHVIETNEDSCTITPSSADVNLQIACPLNDINSKISIGVAYGDPAAGVNKNDLIKSNHDDCFFDGSSPNFDLRIPCPISSGESNVTMKIGYGAGFKSASQSVVNTNCNSCSIEGGNVDFDLQIPCPILVSSDKNVKITYGWRNEPTIITKSFVSSEESCTIATEDIDFNISMNCPVSCSEEATVSVNLGYGDNGPETRTIITTNDDSCTISANSANFDLQVPCPIKRVDGELTLNVSYGEGHVEESYNLFSTDGSCGIQTNSVNCDLEIPCPIVPGNGTLTITPVYDWGYDYHTFVAVADCSISATNPTVNLVAGCPLLNVDFVNGGLTFGGSNRVVVNQGPSPMGDDCGGTFIITADVSPLDFGASCILSGDEDVEIGFEAYWGTGGDNGIRKPVVTFGEESCSITSHHLSTSLSLECPFTEGVGSIKINNIVLDGGYYSWGSSSGELATKIGECKVSLNQVEITPSIDCPLSGLSIQGESVNTGGGGFSIFGGGDCASSLFTIGATFPDVEGSSSYCPIQGEGTGTVTPVFSWGSKTSSKAKVLKVNKCNIATQSPTLSIGLPCPIEGSANLSITPTYAAIGAQSVDIITVDNVACSLSANDALLNVSVPCPLDGLSVSGGKIEFSDDASKCGVVVKQDKTDGTDGDCTKSYSITATFPKTSLNIDCPIAETGDAELTASIGYGVTSSSGSIISVKDCKLSPSNATINFSVPCPVGENAELSLQPVWSSNKATTTTANVITNSGCKIEAASGGISVAIPCPLDNISFVDGGISFSKNGDNKIKVTSKDDGCSKEYTISASMDTLYVSCPLKFSDVKIPIRAQFGGSGIPSVGVFFDKSTCSLSMDGEEGIVVSLACPDIPSTYYINKVVDSQPLDNPTFDVIAYQDDKSTIGYITVSSSDVCELKKSIAFHFPMMSYYASTVGLSGGGKGGGGTTIGKGGNSIPSSEGETINVPYPELITPGSASLTIKTGWGGESSLATGSAEILERDSKEGEYGVHKVSGKNGEMTLDLPCPFPKKDVIYISAIADYSNTEVKSCLLSSSEAGLKVPLPYGSESADISFTHSVNYDKTDGVLVEMKGIDVQSTFKATLHRPKTGTETGKLKEIIKEIKINSIFPDGAGGWEASVSLTYADGSTAAKLKLIEVREPDI